jgi:hypothetical protein
VDEWHGDDYRGIARSLPASRDGREDFLLDSSARAHFVCRTLSNSIDAATARDDSHSARIVAR